MPEVFFIPRLPEGGTHGHTRKNSTFDYSIDSKLDHHAKIVFLTLFSDLYKISDYFHQDMPAIVFEQKNAHDSSKFSICEGVPGEGTVVNQINISCNVANIVL